jgi:predicted metal-binding protein
MKVSVNYDDTDVTKALSKIIKDSNAEEFVKLLAPMICCSNQAVDHLFKLMIGNKLPELIPNGTLCKMHYSNLSYSADKESTKQKFADEDEKVTVTVKEFRGYHDYSTYLVESMIVKGNSTLLDTTYVNLKDLEVIEEF